MSSWPPERIVLGVWWTVWSASFVVVECQVHVTSSLQRDADFPLFSGFFPVIFGQIRSPPIRFPFSVFPQLFRLSKVKIDNARHRRIVPLTRSPPIRIFNGNTTCFLLFHLSLSELSVSFCVHFCETARTRRFSVIFAKVQWHPCLQVRSQAGP